MATVKRLLYGLLKALAAAVLSVTVLLSLALIWFWPRYDYLPVASQSFSVQRLPNNPFIDVDHSPRLAALAGEQGGININGPSLIRVPDLDR